ncbi:LOW QUALITY PROTEIN: filamin-A-like [Limulus polyphemus]|uniref:LOW QUALITY PROTEIN: filamin-A-like n=1 Tax=Limulus polyphemus TaxID=6850 RepID=A0ABM1B5F9_LIMPO|nr:LOW QUALITY PROTEIN: filamin-A-like [Limulus polyphemus]
MDSDETAEQNSSQSGLKARSLEGHAALAMSIKGDEYMWIEIQEKTFTNWVNEQLRPLGSTVTNLKTDFGDGLKLIALIEVLQKRKLKKIKRPINQHQYLENVQIALNAMAADNIKLVNIGNTDIVEGNLKLILGLIWALILRYQIGRTSFPPKKLMLAWLQATLPDLKIMNFTTDWNNGIALSALIDYCCPGLCPNWRSLNPREKEKNCKAAMELAKKEFDIPMILTPDDLASPNLDELSGMTYLSYYMKEDSPGYQATLSWVQKQLPQLHIENFTTDWNDGLSLCALVQSLGATVRGYTSLSQDHSQWEKNLQQGIAAGKNLGVEPLLKARELADIEVEHLGVMAYVARFQWVKPCKKPKERIRIKGIDLNNVHVNKPAHFKIQFLDKSVDQKQLKAEVRSSSGKIECQISLSRNGGTGVFTPTETGMHELIIYNWGDIIPDCPLKIMVYPELSKILYSGIDPCAVGSIVEVLINSNGAGGGDVLVEAEAPSRRTCNCPVLEDKGTYTAAFTPDEIGEWKISVTYSREHIHGSPFSCYVYDPAQIKLKGLEQLVLGQESTFTCDASNAGWGEMKIDIQHNGKVVPSLIEERGNGIYFVTFSPTQPGTYSVRVTFNGSEVKGSPFIVNLAGAGAWHRELGSGSSFVLGTRTSGDGSPQRPPVPSRSSSNPSLKIITEKNLNSAINNHQGKVTAEVKTVSTKQHGTFSASKNNVIQAVKNKSNQHLHSKVEQDQFQKVTREGPSISQVSREVIGMSFEERAEKINKALSASREDVDLSKSTSKDFNKGKLKAQVNKSTAPKVSPSHDASFSRKVKSQEDVRQIKSPKSPPPPPPPKKPSKVDVMTRSWGSREPPKISITRDLQLEGSRQELGEISPNVQMSVNMSSLLHQEEKGHKSTGIKSEIKVQGNADSTKLWEKHSSSSQEEEMWKVTNKNSIIDEEKSTVHAKSKIPVLLRNSPSFSTVDGTGVAHVKVGHQENERRLDPSDKESHAQQKDVSLQHSEVLSKSSIAESVPLKKENINLHKLDTLLLSTKSEMKEASNISTDQLSSLSSVTKETTDLHKSESLTFSSHLSKREPHEETSVSSPISKKGETVDFSHVTIAGSGLKLIPVRKPATFILTANEFEQDDIVASVTAPSGKDIPTRLNSAHYGQYEVEYITSEVGEHKVDVKLCGKSLPGSPFHCFAFDASKIKFGKVPNGFIGKPVEFEINGAEAGSGNLEILVNGGHVTSQVKSLGDHRFLASFVPHMAASHTIDMTFNGEKVPDSPWKCEVLDPVKNFTLTGKALQSFSTNHSTSFEIMGAGFDKEDIRVVITGPSKNVVQHRLLELQRDKYRVDFKGFEVGTYNIEVLVGGQHVPGSPLTTKAYNANQIKLYDMPELAFVGQNCQFQVDASQAGEGQLEISVNEGDVPNHVQVLGGGQCVVSFRPSNPGKHIVDIKFNGENIPESPFNIQVKDKSQFSIDLSNVELIPIGQSVQFPINVSDGSETELKINLISPQGNQVPVKITRNNQTGFLAEFVPKEVGPHTLSIEYAESPVGSSPYTVKVYDSKKVEVSRVPQQALGKTVEFTVDASQAGEGNLEITVSAHGRNLQTQVHPLGSAKFGVSFVPTEPVEHTISVSFNKEAVPGSPFKVKFHEAGTASVTGQSLISACIQKKASFVIQNLPGSEKDLSIRIEGVNAETLPYNIKETGSGNFKVDFTPRETGEYRILVDHLGIPLPGSPFISKVYDIKQIKVRDVGIGVVGKPVTFLVETANAGPGNLEVMINDGQVETSAHAQSPSLYAISFHPKDDQPHSIDVKFNGEPVPGSPYECLIVDPVNLPKVQVTGDGLERVPVNLPVTFFINTQGFNLGQPQVTVMGPSQQPLKCAISGTYQSNYKVEYTPVEVGDHNVDVRLIGHPVGQSPYLVKAYDSTRVKVTDVGNGIVGKPVYFSIDASQAGAGNLEIIVSVAGRNVPNYVQSEGNARFRVNFKPSEPQTHTLSVKFNGEPVPGSPFYVKVDDSSQSVVSGASLKMTSVANGVNFTVDTRGQENMDCNVVVTAPSTKKLPVDIKATSNTTYDVQFSTTEVGPHLVAVMLDGISVPGSPFTSNVYDVSKVKVSNISPGAVGKPVTFQVDASQAGEGTLELVVTTRKSSVRAEVAMKSRGLYNVTFVPQEKVPHYVNITFNEEDIPGSPYKIEIKDSPELDRKSTATALGSKITRSGPTLIARGDGLKHGLVGSLNMFEIDTKDMTSDVDIRVIGPLDIPVQASVVRTEQNSYRAEYHAREVGTYKVEVLHKGVPVTSKPYVVEVCDPSRVKVMDLDDGVVNREQKFKVDTSRAGRGQLAVKITVGGQEVRNSVREISQGVHLVTYIPRSDLPHKIDVFYNGHQAPGCPQVVEMRDPSQSIIAHGSGLKSVSLDTDATFLIETGGFGAAKDFDILISTPAGSPVPVKCYQQRDGSLLAEWTPEHYGSHKIDILYMGKPINGSPYTCQVFDSSKVVIQKIKNTTFSVNKKISFTVTRQEAGYAELDVTVTSPLGRHLPIEVKGTSDGEGEVIEFMPTVPGKYKIGITYGGVEVPGSPVIFIAQEGGTPKVEGKGLITASVNVNATFKVDARGLTGRPEARVDGPDTEAECTIEEEEDGIFIVSYVPQEVGIFDVRVLWNGRELPGSPYHPRVVNPNKVRAIGGWENLLDEDGRISLVAGEEKKISFDTSDAGPGKIQVEFRGSEGMIEIQVEQINNHRYRLCFTPPNAGEYYLYIYYADIPLPKSPYLAYAEPGEPALDHTRVVLRGHGLTSAKVGEEAEFLIDGSEAGPGSPEVSVSGVKADIPVNLIPQGNNVYKAVYTPAVPGAYLLNVMWSERQVKGCPLKVAVSLSCDPNKVACSGDGLRGGTVGKEIKAFIDTRKAGPGELTAHCMGPHKVAYCEMYDHRDGTFTLYLKPQEGGRHMLTVKYGGEHVPGSPFSVRIAGPPDASKVRVYGPGVEPGVLAIYQSRFICDTRGAGAGQLTVRIRGPKGAFRVEMRRESQKDRTILCKYDPTEPGDYRLEVKWSGEHVPGSPFVVMIFDTQEELTRYLQGHHSPVPLTSADYFGGSKTYSTGFGQMSWRGSMAEL